MGLYKEFIDQLIDGVIGAETLEVRRSPNGIAFNFDEDESFVPRGPSAKKQKKARQA